MSNDFGARISKAGKDAQTGIDLDQVFSSKFSTLKILEQATVTITTDGSGNGSLSIPHGLNYTPAYFVFYKGIASFPFLDGSSYANSFIPLTSTSSNWITNFFDAYTDATNLVITATGAAASTTYTFKYFILIDLAQTFSSASGLTLQNDFGLKVSKTGFDVLTAEEYQLAYSQKYKSLQYYDENYYTQALTLPELNSTFVASPQKSGTYVDFDHGLGYPPFFLAFAYNSDLAILQNVLVPTYNGYGNLATSQGGYKQIEAFCDATKVRVSFYQESSCTGLNGDGNGPVFASSTVTIKCFVFTEDLTL